MIDKDNILDKPRIDVEIAKEEVTIGKIVIETTVEIGVGKIIVVTKVDHEIEAPHPESMVIGDITAQTQV